MATGTQGTTARQYPYQMVHYLRKSFTYADAGKALTVGIIPDGALILKPLSGVQVNVAFTAGTNKQLDIGTSATGDLFATNLTLASVGFVPIDEVVSLVVSGDTTIVATPDLTGSDNTAGSGVVVIAYIPNNDQ